MADNISPATPSETSDPSAEIAQLERNIAAWKIKNALKRGQAAKELEEEIRKLEEKKLLFFDFSRRADYLSKKTRLEEAFLPQDQIDASQIIKTAFASVSYQNQTGLDAAISRWISANSSADDLVKFLGGGKSQTIATAFSQFFYNIDYSAEFWEGVSSVYGQEAVWRSLVLDRMYLQFVALNSTETWFAQVPDAERLRQLKELKAQADKTKEQTSQQVEETVKKRAQTLTPETPPPSQVTPGQEPILLPALETIAQDQAARRNIPIEQARQLVWETARVYAAKLDIEGFEVKQGTTPIPIVNQILSRVGIDQQAKLAAPESRDSNFNAHMSQTVQRAENRPFDLRREPDRVLWEQMCNVYQQIFRQNPTYESFQEEIDFLAWADTGTPDYAFNTDNYSETYRTKRSEFGQVASWARQYAQGYAIEGVKSGIKKVGGKIIKQAGQAAAKEAATTTLIASSKLLTKLVAWLGTRLGINVIPFIGQVVSIALIVKDILGFIKGGVSGLFESLKKSLLPEAASKAQIYAKKGLDSALSGMVATVSTVGVALIGAAIGTTVGGPLGTLIGSVIGAIVGWAVGSLFGWLIKGDPDDGQVHVVSFNKNAKRKLGLAVLASVGASSTAAFVAITLIILFVVSMLFPQSQGQAKKLSFKAEIETEPKAVSLADFRNAGETATIVYTIRINAQTTPVLINSVELKITNQNNSGSQLLSVKRLLTAPTIVQPDAPVVLPTYSFEISGVSFENSKIVNTVTVSGTEVDTVEIETETTSTLVRIGEPPNQQPYGYPTDGFVTSLDLEPIKYKCRTPGVVGLYTDTEPDGTCKIGVKKKIVHCGAPLTAANEIDRYGCIAGGIDIAKAGGNVPVHATLDGTVIKSGFDQGPISANCVPVSIPATNIYTFCYPALAGFIYVKSDDGRYVVSYLHLANEGLVTQNVKESDGVRVTKGQEVGKTFTGRICDQLGRCTSTGPHLHYQIFLDKANVEFGNSHNLGSCLEGKILPSDPTDPAFVPRVGVSSTKGPFECN